VTSVFLTIFTIAGTHYLVAGSIASIISPSLGGILGSLGFLSCLGPSLHEAGSPPPLGPLGSSGFLG